MRGRIRSVKPEIHTNEDLWDAEEETGLPLFRAFVGLFNFADREGRFEWRERRLKSAILPYWDGDFSRVLDALWKRGFLVKYETDGIQYGCVRTFKKHQQINGREPPSELPVPTKNNVVSQGYTSVDDTSTTRHARDGHVIEAGEGHVLDVTIPSPPSPTPFPSDPFPEGGAGGSVGGEVPAMVPRAPGARPRPRRDLLHTKIQSADYQPSDEHRAYAAELGLTPERFDKALVELLDKHGLRPHDLPWWDDRMSAFIEQAAKPPSKSGKRGSPDGFTADDAIARADYLRSIGQ